jgi:hypothetical protein
MRGASPAQHIKVPTFEFHMFISSSLILTFSGNGKRQLPLFLIWTMKQHDNTTTDGMLIFPSFIIDPKD